MEPECWTVWKRGAPMCDVFITQPGNIKTFTNKPEISIAEENYEVAFTNDNATQKLTLVVRDSSCTLILRKDLVKLGWRERHKWPRDLVVFDPNDNSHRVFLDIFDDNFNLRRVSGDWSAFQTKLRQLDDRCKELFSDQYATCQKLLALTSIRGTLDIETRFPRTIAELNRQQKLWILIEGEKSSLKTWDFVGTCLFCIFFSLSE